MLPVLFTLTVPAGWGLPLAVLVVVLVAVARAVALVRATRGEGGGESFVGALRSDWWFLGLLGLGVVVAHRAGALTGEVRLPLHTYGLLMALAFLLGVLLAQREARRRGQDPERIGDLSFWILVAALVGSQVFYVFLNLREFSGDRFFGDPPFRSVPRFLLVWRVGLVFYGGFIAAALTALVYMRRRGMSFLAYADTMIPSVAFGHFLGRLGCFGAGCCWGSLADEHLPWAVRFRPGSNAFDAFTSSSYPHRFFSADHLATAPLHPAQLYEAFGELAIFFLLVFLVRPRKRFHGQVLATWLAVYAVLRGVVELYRGDLARETFLRLNSGQWTSVVILAAGLLVWFLSPRPEAAPAPASPSATV